MSTAPVSHPAQNLEVSTVDVETWGKRLRILAWVLAILGVYSAISGVVFIFKAKDLSLMILRGDFKSGWRDRA